MRRLRHFVDAVQALYGSTENWYVGREHIHAHQDALNRIVAVATAGISTEPDYAAQGWTHVALDPRIVPTDGRREDVIRLRKVSVDFYVWASDGDIAESRLCSLIIAIDSIDNVEIVGERWPQEVEEDISSGGAQVILTVVVPLAVVASDEDPAVEPGGDSYGQQQINPDPVTITADLDGTELPSVEIDGGT